MTSRQFQDLKEEEKSILASIGDYVLRNFNLTPDSTLAELIEELEFIEQEILGA